MNEEVWVVLDKQGKLWKKTSGRRTGRGVYAYTSLAKAEAVLRQVDPAPSRDEIEIKRYIPDETYQHNPGGSDR